MACGDLDGLGVPGAGCIRVRQPEPRLRRLAHGLGSPRRVRGAPEPRPQAPRRRTRIPGRTRPTLEPGPPGRDPSTRLHPECCPAAVTGSAEAAGCCLCGPSRPGTRLALAAGRASGSHWPGARPPGPALITPYSESAAAGGPGLTRAELPSHFQSRRRRVPPEVVRRVPARRSSPGRRSPCSESSQARRAIGGPRDHSRPDQRRLPTCRRARRGTLAGCARRGDRERPEAPGGRPDGHALP